MKYSVNNSFLNAKKIISNNSNILKELTTLFQSLNQIQNPSERNMVISHINSLQDSLKKNNLFFNNEIKKIILPKPLNQKEDDIRQYNLEQTKTQDTNKMEKPIDMNLTPLEKATLKRLKKKKIDVKEEYKIKPSRYVQLSNRMFAQLSKSLIKQESFKELKMDLVRANLHFLPGSYISVVLFTTFLSIFVAFFLFFFLLFFNISPIVPFITLVKEDFFARFLKVFWILIAIPISTFIMMYTYPSLEKKSAGSKVDQELPFATINMAAISGSMIDPSNIFSIIISTKEYPYIEKEFKKLLNEVNLLGYDLVTALRNAATNCPSRKLAELFNGIATTINSGGNLAEFFNKRSETLLFEYRIEKEKKTRAAETFMDIYISVVIAAPMILMLLLMMMKISGLGLQLSTGMITLVMVMGVTGINIGFLTFLHLKQSASGE